jgi:hypothetical protein
VGFGPEKKGLFFKINIMAEVKYKRFRKIAWIPSHHLQSKFKLWQESLLEV